MICFQRHTKLEKDMISNVRSEVSDKKDAIEVLVSWEWPDNTKYIAAVIFIIETQQLSFDHLLNLKVDYNKLPRHEIIFRSNDSACLVASPRKNAMVYVFPAYMKDGVLCMELQNQENKDAVIANRCVIKVQIHYFKIPFIFRRICFLQVRYDSVENLPSDCMLTMRVNDAYRTSYPIAPQAFYHFLPRLLLLNANERIVPFIPKELEKYVKID